MISDDDAHLERIRCRSAVPEVAVSWSSTATLCEDRAWLLEYIVRLKTIIATHDLCHDLHGKVGPREFADGCAAEQRKLYGCAPDADKVLELLSALADVNEREANQRLNDPPMGDHSPWSGKPGDGF